MSVILLLYLWIVDTPSTYLMYVCMFMFRILSVGILCTWYLVLYSSFILSVLAVFRLLVYTGIYFQHYSQYILYRYILFQDFTLCISEFLTVRGTAGIRYITRRVFHSNMLQYFQVRYSGYTPSTRSIWPSVVLLTSHTPSTRAVYFGRQ